MGKNQERDDLRVVEDEVVCGKCGRKVAVAKARTPSISKLVHLRNSLAKRVEGDPVKTALYRAAAGLVERMNSSGPVPFCPDCAEAVRRVFSGPKEGFLLQYEWALEKYRERQEQAVRERAGRKAKAQGDEEAEAERQRREEEARRRLEELQEARKRQAAQKAAKAGELLQSLGLEGEHIPEPQSRTDREEVQRQALRDLLAGRVGTDEVPFVDLRTLDPEKPVECWCCGYKAAAADTRPRTGKAVMYNITLKVPVRKDGEWVRDRDGLRVFSKRIIILCSRCQWLARHVAEEEEKTLSTYPLLRTLHHFTMRWSLGDDPKNRKALEAARAALKDK